MFFYGVFESGHNIGEECNAAPGTNTAAGAQFCATAITERIQAVRAGLAVGALLGGLTVWFYKRKG